MSKPSGQVSWITETTLVKAVPSRTIPTVEIVLAHADAHLEEGGHLAGEGLLSAREHLRPSRASSRGVALH